MAQNFWPWYKMPSSASSSAPVDGSAFPSSTLPKMHHYGLVNPSAPGPNSQAWSWPKFNHYAPQSVHGNPPVAGPTSGPVAGACPPLELVFARGTGEPSGFGIVGTPLLNALQTRNPETSGYAVDYPAGSNIVSSAAEGSAKALSHLEARAGECPNAKFILGGYSQGAMVIHDTKLDMALMVKIVGIAVFGDPYRELPQKEWPAELKSKVFAVCATGDPVCRNGFDIAKHLEYAKDVDAAADFLAELYENSKRS